eukprot:scaffold107930_cov19-Tisochrysis_lutea.AAC.1
MLCFAWTQGEVQASSMSEPLGNPHVVLVGPSQNRFCQGLVRLLAAPALPSLSKKDKEHCHRWPEAHGQAEGDAQAYYPMQQRGSEGGGSSDSNSDSDSDASGLVRGARKNVQEDEELGQ